MAEVTVKALLRTVPPAVPGIMFLSGGQACRCSDVLDVPAVCLQLHVVCIKSFCSYGELDKRCEEQPSQVTVLEHAVNII